MPDHQVAETRFRLTNAADGMFLNGQRVSDGARIEVLMEGDEWLRGRFESDPNRLFIRLAGTFGSDAEREVALPIPDGAVVRWASSILLPP